MSTKIKVTIGVCVKNCEKDILQIIERIKHQDFLHEKMEILFIDDGSEDNTLLEISRHAPKMGISYKIFHHSWRGLGFSRNVVLTNARGEYIIWVDDGTIMLKDYVKKQVQFMDAHPNVGVARGIIGTYNGSSIVANLENMVQLAFSYKFAGGYTTKLPGAGGSIYRIQAANHVGGFQKSIQGAGEDTDIVYRMLLAGWDIYITPVEFFIDYNTKFRRVWEKNFWYGYGAHFTFHIHKEFKKLLYKSTPIAGFIEGILASISAYKLTSKKLAFLLPLYFSIKRTAWCIGFIKSHLDSYGHKSVMCFSDFLFC